MQTTPHLRLPLLLTSLAALALLGIRPAQAQTDVTGTNTGTDGAPGSGSPPDSNGNSYGNNGGSGYDAYGFNGETYLVHDANFTGGMGGTLTGDGSAQNYQAGNGGNGLNSSSNPVVTVNSGTFTGGAGGTVDGVGGSQNSHGGTGGSGAGQLFGAVVTYNGGTFQGGVGGAGAASGQNVAGGYGGDGLNVNSSTAFVNGGAFRGGDTGQNTGSAANSGFAFAGSGLNANYQSTVRVNGGMFQGGNGAARPEGGNYSPGDGLIGLGGTVNVYGGTFLGGQGDITGFGIDMFVGSITIHGNFTLTDSGGNSFPDFMGAIPKGDGTLTGFFDNSSTEETFTYRQLGEGGTLNVVPEPSAWLGGGLLAAWAAFGLARRERPDPAGRSVV